MKRFTLAILLTISILFNPCRPVLMAQVAQRRIPDEYYPKLRLFEEFIMGQMEKDRIPRLTIGFTKNNYTWVKGFGYADLEIRFRPHYIRNGDTKFLKP